MPKLTMKLPYHHKLVTLTTTLILAVFLANAQQTVSIGDSQLKSNAVLYLKGNGNQGLILPIVSSVTGSFGEAGMIVYNSSDKNIYVNSGSSWTALGSGSGGANYTLSLSGNNLLLQNNAVTVSTVPLAASPSANQFLMWDGAKWAPTALSQDITNANGTITVNGLKGKTIPSLPAVGVQLLVYDATAAAWKFQTLASSGGTVTNIATGTGLTGGPITTTGTISVDVGTTANKIVQLDANGKLPAIDGSQLTSLPTGFTNPMTTQGDIIFGGTTGTPSRLAGASGFLKSSGATAPSWSSVNLASSTDVAGILPVTNGGTGKTTWSGLLFGSGSTISDISTGTAGQILKVAGTTPTWSNFAVTSTDITDLSIVDADVNASAAIAGTKISPAFGTQNISTTGTGTIAGGIAAGSSSQFTINATGNITKINNVVTSFPSVQGAANTVLVNNGSGTLSWATSPSPFSTNNVVPRGNGSTLVASAIQDDGTNSGVGVAPVTTNKLTVTTSTAGQLQGIYATNSQVGAGSSTAVRGDASGSTNTNFGIYGTATGGGLGATGLYGSATNSVTSQGVYGTASGTGITNAYGVKGSATATSGTNYGVYGDASGGTTNWAGYFKGNAAIEGGLALGSATDFGTNGQVLTSTGSGTAPVWTTVGSSPLLSNSGTNNIFGGVSAGAANTTGINNTFYGFQAGMANTTGTENTFIGRAAGLTNVSGNYNVYVGKDAGNNMTSGGLNTFVGYQAGHNADGINAGTFLGRLAGGNTTTGGFNTFLGEQAGLSNLTGSSNTFVGRTTGGTNTTGGTITLLGSGADVGVDGLSNATAIGANSTVSASNSLVLGSTNIKVGIGTSSPTNALHVTPNSNTFAIRIDQGTNGDGFLSYVNTTSSARTIFSAQSNVTGFVVLGNGWTGIGRSPLANNLEVEGTASKTVAGGFVANSDRRIKTDIQEIDNSFDLMKRLHPVKFKYTEQWKKKHPSIKDQYYYNFIAQEFQQVFPEAAQSSGEYLDGDQQSVLQIDTYHAQITTIKAVQELILKVEELEKENTKLKSEKGELEAKVSAIEDGQKALLKDLDEMKRILGITAQQK